MRTFHPERQISGPLFGSANVAVIVARSHLVSEFTLYISTYSALSQPGWGNMYFRVFARDTSVLAK